MKTVTIMEAQHHLSKVLRRVTEGERVAITRHKRVVAELSPPRSDSPVRFPDFGKRAKAIWGGSWKGASSEDLLDASRGDR